MYNPQHHHLNCNCKICSPATWQNLNCNSLKFTSVNESVTINKTADCTFDFAATSEASPISTQNTETATISGDGSDTFLSVDVNVSATAGNIITVNGDGLYVPTPSLPNYSFSTGLTNISSTITSNLSTGIVGGQSVIGGTAASNNLTLSSTTNATKGKILFGTSGYDEVNNRLGVLTTSPTEDFQIGNGSGTRTMLMDGTTTTLTLQSTSVVGLIFNSVSQSFIRTPGQDFVFSQPSAMTIATTSSYNWISFVNPNQRQIAGTGIGILSDQTFVPISGTATHTSLKIAGGINQTGGASGITRGILIDQTLSSAADYRALEISNTSGTSVYINSTWNTASNPTALFMNVTNTASGATSKVVDIQQDGTSRFTIERNSGQALLSNAGMRVTNSAGGPGGLTFATNTPGPNNINGTTSLGFTVSSSPVDANVYSFSADIAAPTTGNYRLLSIGSGPTSPFDPSSGTATLTVLSLLPTINQTGGASGITRGLLIDSSQIVNAIDYRAIEIDNNSYYAVYQSGALAKNYFNGQTGFGIATPNVSAKVHIDSTTQGFLPPRMTETQRDAISSPVAGLMVYNTSSNKLNVFTTLWEEISSF